VFTWRRTASARASAVRSRVAHGFLRTPANAAALRAWSAMKIAREIHEPSPSKIKLDA
jgi:hypothetical protein